MRFFFFNSKFPHTKKFKTDPLIDLIIYLHPEEKSDLHILHLFKCLVKTQQSLQEQKCCWEDGLEPVLEPVLGPSVPHLDLAGPVAGGGGRRQHGMLGDAQAGLGVRTEAMQRAAAVVIEEVGGAGGAPRGQDASVRRELAAHGVALHLQAGSTRQSKEQTVAASSGLKMS